MSSSIGFSSNAGMRRPPRHDEEESKSNEREPAGRFPRPQGAGSVQVSHPIRLPAAAQTREEFLDDSFRKATLTDEEYRPFRNSRVDGVATLKKKLVLSALLYRHMTGESNDEVRERFGGAFDRTTLAHAQRRMFANDGARFRETINSVNHQRLHPDRRLPPFYSRAEYMQAGATAQISQGAARWTLTDQEWGAIKSVFMESRDARANPRSSVSAALQVHHGGDIDEICRGVVLPTNVPQRKERINTILHDPGQVGFRIAELPRFLRGYRALHGAGGQDGVATTQASHSMQADAPRGMIGATQPFDPLLADRGQGLGKRVGRALDSDDEESFVGSKRQRLEPVMAHGHARSLAHGPEFASHHADGALGPGYREPAGRHDEASSDADEFSGFLVKHGWGTPGFLAPADHRDVKGRR